MLIMHMAIEKERDEEEVKFGYFNWFKILCYYIFLKLELLERNVNPSYFLSSPSIIIWPFNKYTNIEKCIFKFNKQTDEFDVFCS